MSRIGNKQYRIRFEHNNQPKYITLSDIYGNTYRVKNKEQSSTACHIEEMEETKPTYTGITLLAPNDRYSKELGRKKSLTYAMESLQVYDRDFIWNSYLNRKKNTIANREAKLAKELVEDMLPA
jgi:hypothetical protein